MYTYALLSSVVLLLLALYLFVNKNFRITKHIVYTIAVLFVCTALFDSLIIYFTIVAYDKAKILNMYIGKAPLEDFAYPLAAAFLLPYIWSSYDKKD